MPFALDQVEMLKRHIPVVGNHSGTAAGNIL